MTKSRKITKWDQNVRKDIFFTVQKGFWSDMLLRTVIAVKSPQILFFSNLAAVAESSGTKYDYSHKADINDMKT